MQDHEIDRENSPSDQLRWTSILGLLLLLSGISVTTTWPLVTMVDTHLPDRFLDSFLHVWNTWWVGKALDEGLSIYFTESIFYPDGASLITQNIAWMQVIQSLLLERIVGVNPITAYNVSVLLTLVFCGLSAFTLVYWLTGRYWPALLAAVIYQAWPYRVARLDLPNLLGTFWIPLFLLFLLRTIKRQKWQDAVLCGLFFALVGYTRWQQMIPAAIMGIVVAAVPFVQWLRRSPGSALGMGGLAIGVALILISPPTVLLLQEQRLEAASGVSTDLYNVKEETIMSADLLAFVTPSEFHPVWGGTTQPIYRNYYFDRTEIRRRPAYIGAVASMLAAIGLWTFFRRGWAWLLLGIVMASLSLGPTLRINGSFYEAVPTLYRVLTPLQFVRLIRDPERFVMFIALPVAVLAAWGMVSLIKTFRLDQYRLASGLITFGFMGLILYETATHQTIFRDTTVVHPFMAEMANDLDEFALLNIPIEQSRATFYMFDQIGHGKSILQGNISRLPANAYQYVDDNRLLRGIRQELEIPNDVTDIGEIYRQLREDQIKYIVMHRALVDVFHLGHWERHLPNQPIVKDDVFFVYQTDPQFGSDIPTEAETDIGLHMIKRHIGSICEERGQMMELGIAWGNPEPLDQELDVLIRFEDDAGESVFAHQTPVIEGQPTSVWERNSLMWGFYAFEPDLPEGTYRLTVQLVLSESAQPVSEPIQLVGNFEIAPRCDYGFLENTTDADAVFGDVIRLIELGTSLENSCLQLKLHWRAEQRGKEDYQINLELIDLSTESTAASMVHTPRQGSYRTGLWWPGDRLEEQICFDSGSLSDGSYRIDISLVHAATQDKLPVSIVSLEGERIEAPAPKFSWVFDLQR